jgi:hypothetical protein
VYFQPLQERLVDIARERIRAGVFTERKLARLSGISQPHLHNVLKRIRTPSTSSADRLMEALGLRVPDLLWRATTDRDFGVQAVPIMRNRIGPGTDASLEMTRGFVPLPESLLRDLVDPIAARVGPDLVLPKALTAHDLVLLDQNPGCRNSPSPESIWVVSEGAGLRLRYIRADGDQLFIANEMTLDDPRRWQSISRMGRNILDVVRAKIVWMSREMNGRL